MTTTDFTFNTGRQYAPEGQPISVKVLRKETDEWGDWYVCQFNDEARNIRGEVRVSAPTPGHVLAAYDAGQYN